MSANRLGQSKHVWFLVTGKSKCDAIQAWNNNQAIPAASIIPDRGVDIFSDQPEV
jgi:6-phosphogluconolactonase/glucosamine-6-phosphate isomerase/deaminase